MKRHSVKLAPLFLTLQAVYPVCRICAALAGWQFVPGDEMFVCIIFAILNAGLAMGMLFKRNTLSRGEKICISIALPVGLLNGLLLLFDGGLAMACAVLVSVICCFGLYRRGKGIKVLRIFTGGLAGFFAVLLFSTMPFFLFFGQIGTSTVMKSIPSPDGRHTAWIVDVDEGALGGSTVVRVAKASAPFRAAKPFFSVWKNVYIGDWGMVDELSVEWVDEDSLLVDGKQYGF